MKYTLIIFFMLSLFSCRSTTNQHRSSDLSAIKVSDISSFTLIKDSLNRAVFQRIQSEQTERIYIREYYKPEPGDTGIFLKSETTIDWKQNQKTDIDTQENGTKNTQQNTTGSDSTIIAASTNVQIEKQTDSRLIQGKELFWLSLGVGTVIIIGVVLLIWYLRRKKVPP